MSEDAVLTATRKTGSNNQEEHVTQQQSEQKLSAVDCFNEKHHAMPINDFKNCEGRADNTLRVTSA